MWLFPQQIDEICYFLQLLNFRYFCGWMMEITISFVIIWWNIHFFFFFWSLVRQNYHFFNWGGGVVGAIDKNHNFCPQPIDDIHDFLTKFIFFLQLSNEIYNCLTEFTISFFAIVSRNFWFFFSVTDWLNCYFILRSLDEIHDFFSPNNLTKLRIYYERLLNKIRDFFSWPFDKNLRIISMMIWWNSQFYFIIVRQNSWFFFSVIVWQNSLFFFFG